MSLSEVTPETSGRLADNLITVPTKLARPGTHFTKFLDSIANKITNTKSQLIFHSQATEAKKH